MTEMSVNNKREMNTKEIKHGLKFMFCHDIADQIQCIMISNKSLDIVEVFRYIGTTARNKLCIQETT